MKLSEVYERYDVDTYREALKIDQHRLDDMLMQQPFIQQTIAEMAAELCSMRDAAKERLSRVDAQAAKIIRNRITVEEGKASEARVDREVPLTREHKEAFYMYNELCALTAQWEALKDTARNRAFVIRDLVSLYTANFFTDTSFRSASNPQAVQQLAYQEARAALSEGRRARRMLSGVDGEVELRAKVDSEDPQDAELVALESAPAPEAARRPPASGRRPLKGREERAAARRAATKEAPKSSGAEGIDKGVVNPDTDAVETGESTNAKPSGRRAEIRDKIRNRSQARAIAAESGELSEESGAHPEVGADESSEQGQESASKVTDTAPRTRRRRNA